VAIATNIIISWLGVLLTSERLTKCFAEASYALSLRQLIANAGIKVKNNKKRRDNLL
jgi:hypothetical protein